MEPHHHHHHHHQLHHQQQQLQIPPSFSSHHQSHDEAGTITTATTSTGSDRFPQWSLQETKEFLMIRADLDQTFMETKRNKKLWQVISNNMKEKGYQRSAEQCKCKWKNLVTRYKGCETMETEALRQQFPFYNELQAIFTSRMQRMLWAEEDGTSKKNKAMDHHHHHLSSEDEEENIGNELLEGDDDQQQKGITRKKKKAKIVDGGGNSGRDNNRNNMLKNLKEILEEFMRQQMEIEAQWMEAYEARENERRMKEFEWRQAMEAMENERIIMDQRWREREEQRRIREEARSEKRDTLITALLNKLEREDM